MNITQQLKKEKENLGQIFLYLSGNVLKAYELSAYILTKYFPDVVELVEEVNRVDVDIFYATSVDPDFVISNFEDVILISNDCIEMACLTLDIQKKIPDWIDEFKLLKKKQQEANGSLGYALLVNCKMR